MKYCKKSSKHLCIPDAAIDLSFMYISTERLQANINKILEISLLYF